VRLKRCRKDFCDGIDVYDGVNDEVVMAKYVELRFGA